MGAFDTQAEKVGAAAEHIEEASIADGFEKERKPVPEQVGEPPVDSEGLEPGIVGAAAEHIEDAAIANGQVDGR